jgi:indolepyruvate ferredoxin oxidoreductase
VWDRSRLAEAEQVLADTPGTTVLIHDQECATELRRKRKRGLAPMAPESIVINERLCEGCGDCGEKSNCLSVHPVETEFGRKTRIHQASCNADLTCVTGDCPAFMSVKTGPPGARPRRASASSLGSDELPEPAYEHPGTGQAVRLMGIGGSGVVTTSHILATAAALAGFQVRTLDQTGLAQKGGAVVSDVKFSSSEILESGRISAGECDLYIGYDLLVAADPKNLEALARSGTVVASTSVVPTGAMVSDRSVAHPEVGELLDRIAQHLDGGRSFAADARPVVEALLGAEQFLNMFLLGVAYQLGALALSHQVIEEAICLSGLDVDANTQAFRRGRQLVYAPDALEAVLDDVLLTRSDVEEVDPNSRLNRLLDRRTGELTAYQNGKYAQQYLRLVSQTLAAESRTGIGSTDLSEAVARYYYKLLAYKDEYEVARLARDPETLARIRAAFGTSAKVSWKLQPPTLRALGLRRKITVGRWFTPVFRALYRLRWLRGTPFDPFGRTETRRVERRLAREYADTMRKLLPLLDRDNHETLVEIARLPDMVRGYEDVKLRSVRQYDERREELLREVELSTKEEA